MEDYLGAKKDGRTFKDNLLSFWDILVCESQESALFDQQLMEKCMDYVIALSWYGALRQFYYYLFFLKLSCALLLHCSGHLCFDYWSGLKRYSSRLYTCFKNYQTIKYYVLYRIC